jgi:NAD(P)-dependent dehydrogenase (short-subunit alcohol dehydrogenase family)
MSTPGTPVALVAGAGKGIGRETARLLAATHSVAILARTESDLVDTASVIGARALPIPADVATPAEVTLAVARTIEKLGRLDVLVNCAGVAPSLSIEETSVEEWHRILDVNLSSVFYSCKAAWPAMKNQGGGVVVNVSSEAARDPFAGFAAYGAAKAGVNLLGRALAKEGGPHNIRIHTVAPAAVETQMFRKLVSTDQWPTEKCLEPVEVARVIVDCVTGSLRYTSGDVIWVHKTV